MIQCSETELRTALARYNAFPLDGYYRIMSVDYEIDAFTALLQIANLNVRGMAMTSTTTVFYIPTGLEGRAPEDQ